MTRIVLVRVGADALDETVLQLLQHVGQPLCVSTMSFLLDRPSQDICMTLNRLRKYGQVEVKRITARRMQLWAARGRQS